VSPSALAPSATESIWLNTATAAGLAGLSAYTLQRARHDRPDLDVPPHERRGRRGVAYPLAGVLGWSQRRGVALCWQGVPLSVALPVFDAFTRRVCAFLRTWRRWPGECVTAGARPR